MTGSKSLLVSEHSIGHKKLWMEELYMLASLNCGFKDVSISEKLILLYIHAYSLVYVDYTSKKAVSKLDEMIHKWRAYLFGK